MTGRQTSIDLDQLAELREVRGLTYRRIAEIVGRSAGAVAWQCLKNGIEKPGELPRVQVRRDPLNRGGGVVRYYSPEEDAELLRLEATGLNYYEIARAMGRANSSIRGRLLTLARQDERAS